MSKTWKTMEKRDIRITRKRPSWETKVKRTRDYLAQWEDLQDDDED